MLTGRLRELALTHLVVPALSRCRPRLAYAALEVLGDLRCRTAPRTRRALRQRIVQVIGPGMTASPDEVVRGVFVARMKGRMRELPLSRMTDKELARAVPIEGREHLDDGVGRGAGAIVLGTHIGPGRLICYVLRRLGYPLLRVGYPARGDRSARIIDETVYARLERRLGARFEDILLPRGAGPVPLAAAAKRMCVALGAGKIVYLAADGRGSTRPVLAPLFGRPVGFPRAWVSLARLTWAPAVPGFMVSRCRSESFLMRFEAPLPQHLVHRADPGPAIAAYADRLEAHVRRFPCNAGPLFLGRPPGQALDPTWSRAFAPLEPRR